MNTGIYCPATKANCDRPCMGAECQRIKQFGMLEHEVAPRPPAPDMRPVVSAAQLRAARAYLGLTLKEMGKKCALSSQTLCDLENGNRPRPQEETLRKVVNAFYDMGIELFGADGSSSRGIRDFIPTVRGK